MLLLQGRCPDGAGHATWHQTHSLRFCLPFTEFGITKSGPVPDLLKATETSSSDSHLFSQRRGLVNAKKEQTENPVAPLQNSGGKRQTDNKPWLGDKRENKAKLQGS